VPPARPWKKSHTVLIVVAVLGGLALLTCVVVAFAYAMFLHEIEEPITEAERNVLLTIEKLAEFAEIEVDPARATLKHIRHLDGSREVTYEYESPDGAGDPLYLSSSAALERNVSDARTVYMGSTLGFKLGMALEGDGGLRQVVKPGLFHWGEESRAVVLMKGDEPVGNLFVARKGTKVFLVILVGVFFDEREDVQAALGPILERFEAYNP
jgi:hypothetical protein